MKLFKRIVFVLMALALAGFIGKAVFDSQKNGGPQPVKVRVEPVAFGTITEVVSAPGRVEPETKVQISARVMARITALPLIAGQKVTKGDPTANPPVPASVLVKLDATDLEARLRAAEARYAAQAAQHEVAKARIPAQEAQVAALRAGLEEATRDLDRQKSLFESHDVSRSALDASQSRFDQQKGQYDAALQNLQADQMQLKVLEHQLEAAGAEISQARDSLSYTVISSPIDGIVTRVNAEVGELAVTGTMNNPGTVILEVADLSKMLAIARVDESNVIRVQPGQKAVVRLDAYADAPFDGEVETVALVNSEDTDRSRYYKTEVVIKQDGRRIASGLSAEVEIQTQTHANVLTVPSQAVVGRPIDGLPEDIRKTVAQEPGKSQTTVVYRWIDGKAVVTPVKTGASDVAKTLVKSGLKEGDRIIVGPFKELEKLKHDAAVEELKAEEKKDKKEEKGKEEGKK